MTSPDFVNIVSPPAWVAEGLCAQVDPELFFPEKGGSTREAKQVCLACPVRAECLAYALDNRERFDVWGGASQRERHRLTHQVAGLADAGDGREVDAA